jgi:hypothetical protein
MLKMRKLSVLVGAALVLFALVGAQAANEFSRSALPPGRSMTFDLPTAGACAVTQNTDPNQVVSDTSVACAAGGVTTDNSYVRVFDLDDDHSITGQFCVKSLDYAIETAVGAGGTQTMSINTYCLPEGLPPFFAFMVFQDGVTFPQADANLAMFNQLVGGCCNADVEELVVEIKTDDCLTNGTCLQNFIGANDLGQIGPSYIAAEDCGIVDPTDVATFGFPNSHWIMEVFGEGDCVPPPTPAVGGIGMALMVLVFLGTSAYFVRRRRLAS